MALDESRTTADTIADHLSDHNILHKLHNILTPLVGAPVSPDSDDDEFDDATITGWTSQYVGTAPTWSESDGRLFFSAPAEANTRDKAQVKTLPVSGDWEYEARLDTVSADTTNFQKPAMMFLGEGGTTADVCIFGVAYTNGTRLVVNLHTDYSTYSSAPLTIDFPDPCFTGVWYRIQKVGTTYSFKASPNGQQWITYYSGTLPFVPTNIGLGGTAENTSLGVHAAWHHFRRIS